MHDNSTLEDLDPVESRSRRGRLPGRVLAAASLALLALAVAGGVAFASIPDSGTGVFHGCVTKATGALRLVDPSKSQSCSSSEKTVSWNQSGQPGPPGTNGTTILSGATAPSTSALYIINGDYYLDTATHVLYGPAVVTCKGRDCSTNWGSGTSLLQPAGSAGQSQVLPKAYETATSSATPANIPSGQSTTILAQTLPKGDYEVSADVGLLNSSGTAAWDCTLDATNPGGNPVTLSEETATSPGQVVGRSTTWLSLEGIVSIAAGGTISITCDESAQRKSDSSSSAQILSTQIGGFTIVPPG